MVLTLDFVQRTALSILTRHLTDNISNNLHSNNKKNLLCVCSKYEIFTYNHSYRDPVPDMHLCRHQ